MHIRAIASDKYWADIWFAMADGSKTQIDSIKRADVVEFFHLLRNFENKIKKENGRR